MTSILTRKRRQAEAEMLNVFADAIRECLGLEPIPRPKKGRGRGRKPTVEERFYVEPLPW